MNNRNQFRWRILSNLIRGAVLFASLAPSTPACAQSSEFDGVDDAEGRRVMQQAHQQIEEDRKGDFALTLLDEAGKPISGDASIELVEHEFLFGAAMTYALQLHDKPLMAKTHASAKEVASELFNIVTINCHWDDLQPMIDGPHQWTETDRMIAWAKENGLKVRGHALIYLRNPIPAPPWLKQVKSTDQWWQLVDSHFKAVAQRYSDDYLEMDVMNEPRYQTSFRAQFKWLPRLDDPQTARQYFQIARKHFGKTTLMPLDQWTLTGNKGNPEREKAMAIIGEMIRTGADIDAIGTQGHFFVDRDSTSIRNGNRQGGRDAFRMKEINRGLDMLAEFGKPVHITEFNPPSRNRKHLAQYPLQPRLSDKEIAAWTANFYTLAFSKPHIKEVTCWFVIDGVGGNMMDAGLLRLDGTKKPLYHALKKLLKEDWSTRWEGKTAGNVKFRGFYGTYEIEVAGYKTRHVELGKNLPRNKQVELSKVAK